MFVPFYSSGLKFTCRRCGACCRYDPGFVFLSKNDVERLCEALSLEEAEFVRRYCRVVRIDGKERLSLKEERDYDCIFWKDGGCRVYEARPFQCRSFPFWSNILKKGEAWEAHSEGCPGMGSGTHHHRDEIERWLSLKDYEDYDYMPNEEGE